MMLKMFKLRTIFAMLAMGLGLALLGTVIDPGGVLFCAAVVLGVVLVSFTDPYTFGWTDRPGDHP